MPYFQEDTKIARKDIRRDGIEAITNANADAIQTDSTFRAAVTDHS